MRIYTVSLEGMEFVGFHGCREDEKVNGNIFKVDFEAEYQSDCADKDDLTRTQNYGKAYEAIAAVMHGERRNLLETIASEIVDRIRRQFPGYSRIKVTVAKKNPPVAGPCAWSAITQEWQEND